MAKTTLEDTKVTQMDNSLFVTDEKLYRFSLKGIPTILLPNGSLIFTGEKCKGPGGFPHAIFAVWKGKNEINEVKLICIKQKEKKNGN